MLNSKRKLKSVMYGHTMKWAGDQKSKVGYIEQII